MSNWDDQWIISVAPRQRTAKLAPILTPRTCSEISIKRESEVPYRFKCFVFNLSRWCECEFKAVAKVYFRNMWIFRHILRNQVFE